MLPFALPSAAKWEATTSGIERDVSQMKAAAPATSSANLSGPLSTTRRIRRLVTDHRAPRGYSPPGHQPIQHVRIDLRKGFRDRRRVGRKQQYRPLDRIAHGAREQQLSALRRLPGERQVSATKLGAPRQVVGGQFVNQQVMHQKLLLGCKVSSRRCHRCPPNTPSWPPCGSPPPLA